MKEKVWESHVIEGRKKLNFSPDEFSVWIPIQVRFCDTDMMGHINNVSMIAFLETSRVEYINKMRRVAQTERIERDIFSIILAEITCVYRAQAFINDEIKIGIRMSVCKRKSFVFDYVVMARSSDGAERKVADAQSIQVMFDYAEGKAIEIPEEFIKIAEKVEGRKIIREP